MTAHRNVGAAAPGPVTPASDKALAGGTAQGFGGQSKTDRLDCASAPRTAHDYLARLPAEQASPDELALSLAALYGATLREVGDMLRRIGGRHA